MLQDDAGCGSVLSYVNSRVMWCTSFCVCAHLAVCCSVWQRVAVCCSVLQCSVSLLQDAAGCCRMAQSHRMPYPHRSFSAKEHYN